MVDWPGVIGRVCCQLCPAIASVHIRPRAFSLGWQLIELFTNGSPNCSSHSRWLTGSCILRLWLKVVGYCKYCKPIVFLFYTFLLLVFKWNVRCILVLSLSFLLFVLACVHCDDKKSGKMLFKIRNICFNYSILLWRGLTLGQGKKWRLLLCWTLLCLNRGLTVFMLACVRIREKRANNLLSSPL